MKALSCPTESGTDHRIWKSFLLGLAFAACHTLVFLWCYALELILIPTDKLADMAKMIPHGFFSVLVAVLGYPVLTPLVMSRNLPDVVLLVPRHHLLHDGYPRSHHASADAGAGNAKTGTTRAAP